MAPIVSPARAGPVWPHLLVPSGVLLVIVTIIVWLKQMLWVWVWVGVWGGCRRRRCGRARARGRGRVRVLVGLRQPARMAAKLLASRMSAMV